MLTVRHVAGASPLRVILDSKLLVPTDPRMLSVEAATIIFTSDRADPDLVRQLRSRAVRVEVVGKADGLLPIREVLRRLKMLGVGSLLVEGESCVITTVLGSGQADRLVVSIALTVIGSGTEAVADLGIGKIGDGIRLTNRFLLMLNQT